MGYFAPESASRGGGMSEEAKATGLDFGALIAFVAPGFVAFQGLAYHVPTAACWIQAASEKEQNVGVFLFVALASLSIGLAVSGVRSLVVDFILKSKCLGKLGVPESRLNWALIDDTNLQSLITIRDNFYRYYQFYANTAVAFLLVAICQWGSTRPKVGCIAKVVFWLTVIVLFLSARQSFALYIKSVNELVSKRRETT
jgi:hypothetical protein